MNTRRNLAQRLEEEIANAGVLPLGYQVPLLEEENSDDQDPVNLPFMNGDIMVALFKMAQAITTQAQAATTQAQAMTAQANREVVPRANQ